MLSKLAVGLIILSVVVIAMILIFGAPESKVDEVAPTPNLTTLRITEGGEVVGFVDHTDARAWLGIPYAQPPIGDLRWAAPRKLEQSAQRIEAVHYGPDCVQYVSQFTGSTSSNQTGVVGSEDCLYLNVWSPPNAVDLPVMLWLHGGGNSIGSGSLYDGSSLASRYRVVVVTINFRLGVLGWFHHPALARQSARRSGNFGLLDIIRALHWTRDNIDEFGGDPNNVTLFGESAGGANTLAMITSPMARGLFHRAIVQSGSLLTTDIDSASNYVEAGGHPNSSKELVARLLVSDQRASSLTDARELQDLWDDDAITSYLFAKQAAELVSAVDPWSFGMVRIPQLFLDGTVLPKESADDALQQSDIPLILGSNRDEPALFMVQNPEHVNSFLGIFNSLKNKTDYQKRVHYGGLAWKVRGVDAVAQALVASGRENVFTYRFDWDEEPTLMFFDLSVALGAAHGLELAFLFDTFSSTIGERIYPNDENQHLLSDQMKSYWTNFAYDGTPGRGRNSENPEWLPWGRDGKTTLVLDTPTDQGIRMIDEVVSWESIKTEILNDQEFNKLRTQCELYTQLFKPLGMFDQDEYDSMGCSEYDPAEFVDL